MPKPPEFANWPFDFAWWFIKNSQNDPQVPQQDRIAGHVRLAHLESGQAWNVPVRTMDAVAQKFNQDREVMQGGLVKMGDGTVHEIPFRPLDDESDAMVARGMRPSSFRDPITVTFRDGMRMEKVPMEWWEERVVEHINRRKLFPPVPLDMGGGTVISLAFECFDALCKDFLRRRGDFTAAGWWPELLMQDYGQFKEGPRPVDGRANALGQGVQVMQGQQAQQPGQVTHPGVDNEGVV